MQKSTWLIVALCALAAQANAFLVDSGVKTFGVGLKGVGLSNGKILLNHTLDDDEEYAYLSHLWMTYITGSDELAMSHTFFDYAAGDFFPHPDHCEDVIAQPQFLLETGRRTQQAEKWERVHYKGGGITTIRSPSQSLSL